MTRMEAEKLLRRTFGGYESILEEIVNDRKGWQEAITAVEVATDAKKKAQQIVQREVAFAEQQPQ